MKNLKLSFISLTVLALSTSLIAPAQAESLPLNYEQYIASQGYKDLQAASVLYATKLESATGIVFNLEMSSGSTGTITGTVKATKTAATSVLSMAGESVSVSYFGGSYFVGLNEAGNELSAKNPSSVIKRVPSSKIKFVKLSSAPSSGSSFLDMNPSSIFSGESSSAFVEDAMSMISTNFTFSEVTSGPNVEDPTATDYRSAVNMTDSETGIAVSMDTVQTFNAAGFLTSTRIDQDVSLLGMKVSSTIKLTQSIDNTLVLTPPATSAYITSAKFVSLDRQISAEAALKTNATKLVTKAKSLAKTAKKPLSGSHLTSAAKSLKLKTKSIPNGTKLTGTYKGVSGSLCVTAYKGVSTIKNC